MKIAIDMDGVLCDFVSDANKRVKEIWGIDIKYEEVDSYSYAAVLKKYGLDLPDREIYQTLLFPGMFRKLAPCPQAIETVKKIVEKEHEITILTKILMTDRDSQGKRFAGDNGVSEKLDWLNEHLKDIPYSVIMVSRMEDKRLVNAHVLVDDDERALMHPSSITICVAQPWNKKYRDELKGMQTTINNMSELLDQIGIIEDVLKTKEEIELDLFKTAEHEVGIHESTPIKSGIYSFGH